MMAKDWEQGVDYHRLGRPAEARASRHPLRRPRRVLCLTSTTSATSPPPHRRMGARQVLPICALPGRRQPFLWDPAPPPSAFHRLDLDNVAAPITTMQGAIPPSMNVQHDFAKQIKKRCPLRDRGGAAGHRHDGDQHAPRPRGRGDRGRRRQQALLEARVVKTADESIGSRCASMVDATYVDIAARSGPEPRRMNSSDRQ